MCFGMTYSARLPASTVHDVEGTLYKFIPSGVFSHYGPIVKLVFISIIDYLKNEITFNANTEKEATTFLPPGDKVFSYTRPATHLAPTAGGKGKSKKADELDPDSTNVSTFEAYHVCPRVPHFQSELLVLMFLEFFVFRQRGKPLGSGTYIGACSYLSCYISKRDHISRKMRINGSS